MDLRLASSPDILGIYNIPKERTPMNFKKALGLLICIALAISCFAQGGMGVRGKAEMKSGTGSITVDYGRPELKGRDMLSKLPVGQSWRMGSNQATVLTTPVDLTFGATKVPKGAYSLFLKLTAPDKYELVFNSQTGQWGMQHDAAKDVFQVPMKKEVLTNSVEVFTIDLKSNLKGGVFVLNWGTMGLSADFQVAQ
jgi:hypothetical protein